MRRPRLDGVGISQVHQLEPRMLLSTIVVSTANDSGAGSLRAAVTDATNGDAIVFAKRLAGHTITLRSEIDITSNISISGPAGRPVVLSGGGATRVLELDGAHASLANLVITQGSAAIGGGILESSGSLSLNNVRFTGNVAFGSTTQIAQGGAIAQQSGELTINRSTFTGNRVVGDPNSPVVYPPPSSSINPEPGGSVSTPLIVIIPSPLIYGGEADGGAIATQAGTLSITKSTFRGNKAVGSSVTTENIGGDAYGGAISIANASLTSSNTVFQGNQAIAGTYVNGLTAYAYDPLDGGSANGGAIVANSASLKLMSETIRGNTAAGGNVQSSPDTNGGQGGYGLGGGISLLNDSTASLFGGTISHNQATGGTGAGPSDPLQTVYLSSGAAFGGGISAQGASSASITRTTFLNDAARSGNSSTVATASSVTRAGNASGGAIDFDTGGNLILTRATLNHNSAIGGNAGAAPGSAFGGGIAIDGANSVTIVKSTMQGNLAETGQGFVSSPDVYTEYALSSGGAIYVDNAATSLSMSASRIIANRAVGNDNGAASGGALMLNDVAADLTNDTLQSNKAIGGSVSTSVLGQATGGAIAITGSTMTLTNSRLVNNQATTATVDELFGDPGSSSDASLGGAIFNDGADVQIVGGSFVGNQAIGGTGTDYTAGANGQGGAIFSIGSGDYGNGANALVTVTGVMFQNNLAAGGAVATQLEFVPSTAGAGEGGAIDIEEYSQLDLSSSKVTANQAMATGNGSGNGGGLYLAALSTNTLAQDTVVKNKASTAGDNIDNLNQ